MMHNKEEIETYLKGIVLNLPETPGCYQYLDENGKVIYVGKAKNLKRRVSSYFNKEQQTRKTKLLVTHSRHSLRGGENGRRRAAARKQPD